MNSIRSTINHSACPDSNAIDIITLLNEIGRRKYFILAFTLLISISTLALVMIVPPKWEISARINIGRIGGELIEPADRFVETIKQKSFSRAVLNMVDGDLKKTDTIFNDTLAAKLLANEGLIEIRFRAPSQVAGQRLILAISKHIEQVHKKSANPILEGLRKSLLQTERRLKELELQRERLINISKQIHHEGNMGAIESVLLEMLISDRNKDILFLMESKAKLENMLGPGLTYATRLMDEVTVEPSSPRKEVVVAIATIIGLFLAIFVTLLLHSSRIEKQQQFKSAN